MRLDLVLHHLCLYKTRSQAGKACDGSKVRLNGDIAKPSRDVKVGDRISYRDPGDRFERVVEILILPERQVSKVQARDLYRVLEEREIERPWKE